MPAKVFPDLIQIFITKICIGFSSFERSILLPAFNDDALIKYQYLAEENIESLFNCIIFKTILLIIVCLVLLFLVSLNELECYH